MSIAVKNWKPREGCEECAQAKRIMDDMNIASYETSRIALQKIRSQAILITELQIRIRDIEYRVKDA